MKTLFDLAKEAQTRGASGLRMIPGMPLQLRINKAWSFQGSTKLSAADVRNAVWPILTADEKKRLDDERVLEGAIRGQGAPVQFQYFMNESGVLGTFAWHSEADRSLTEWAIPAFTLEKIQRQSGLNLLVGPIESGKSCFLHSLAKTLSETHGPVLMVSDHDEFEASLLTPLVPVRSLSQMSLSLVPSKFILIDSDSRDARFFAMNAAAQGKTVILTMTAKSMNTAFESLTESVSEMPQKTQMAWTLLAENLVTAFGLRLVPGLESGLQPVFELLTDTPEIKAEFSKGSAQGLVEIMAKGGDKSGMRTLNQALLQLLIKRRIELRTGFDESSNPQELDELLKKVGV